MEFKSVTTWPLDAPASFQGYLNINYNDIVETLGDSEIDDGEKTDAEWWLLFKDGTFATIYNYKDGVNYNGTSGTPVSEITNWHIGGINQDVLRYVYELFGVE